MKEASVDIGKLYALRSQNGGEVTNENGETIVTLEANKQQHITAQESVWLVPDDCKVTKANFKYAPLGGGQPSGGGANENFPPSGAVKVDYLEATGTQYIKTGFYPNQDSGIRTVHQQVTEGNYRVAGAGENVAGNTGNCLMTYSRNSAGGSAFGFYKWVNPSGVTIGWDEIQEGKTNFLNGKYSGTYLTGESFSIDAINKTVWDTPFSPNSEVYLFAICRDRAVLANYSFRGKIYEAQLSQGEEIVREYMPYVSKEGVPFMFEKKLGRVLTNAGTGAFRIGIGSLGQLTSVLNNLPDRNGDSEPSELLVRLEPELQTEEVYNRMDNIALAKNWSIVEP